MSAQPRIDEAEWTTSRLLAWTSEFLARHGVEDARLASEVLLASGLKCRRIDLYARYGEVPDRAGVERFRGWVKRAAAHEPIAYLVGEKEFFSLPMTVTPDVLIPRPESETLVEAVVDYCKQIDGTAPRILDLGTGSGCLAVAILTQLGDATVVASDVSAAAMDVAKSNAERHGVADRLTLVRADRLAIPADALPEDGFDVLVSNPPYIAAEAVAALDATVRDYEPHVALTDGEDGLSFYRAIAADGSPLLAPGGVVIVEVGDGQAAAVRLTMEQGGRFDHRRTWRDRVVGAERALMFGLR